MSRKTVVVRMVTAAGCERCKDVLARVVACAKRANVVVALEEFDSQTSGAVDLGVEHGLDDVPSVVIAGRAFCGTGFRDEDLEKAMEAAR